MAKVELKKPVVEEISAQIADAESVILVNYSGLTVEQDTKLRKELREAGVVPSREELLGKLLGSIQSPIANLARVLNQIAESKGGEAAEA